MSHILINQLETAQRITLGQVDREAINMAVDCEDTLAIVKHGRVESYVVPADVMQSLIEAHNTALKEMGQRVAKSVPIEPAYTTHDICDVLGVDVNAIRDSFGALSRALQNDPAIEGMKTFRMPLVKLKAP